MSTLRPSRRVAASRALAAAGWAGVAFGALAVATCRKPPPDELVYTGTAPGTAPTSPPTVTVPVPMPSGSGPGPGGGDFTKAALLSAVADCTFARYRDFEAGARALRDAEVENAAAPTVEGATRVRAAWLAAADLWQEAEPFRLGPAAGAAEPGGRDLRDQIYAWPVISRCKVEEQIVNGAYAGPGFATSLVNGRGLFALEYLSFYEGADNACSPFSPINAEGGWAALTPDELVRRKAAYGAAAAGDVLVRAGELVAAWDPTSGPFRADFLKAGAGSTTYPSEQDALNAVNQALFYVEKEVKDYKLGRPLGYYECAATTCPEAVESLYARTSTANVRANLRGFGRLFNGCGEGGAGLGFDDWLSAVGASDLAGRMRGALAGAEAAALALELPVDQALTSDPTKAAALHASVKALTDLLKTEFITVLNLELPKGAEGDND